MNKYNCYSSTFYEFLVFCKYYNCQISVGKACELLNLDYELFKEKYHQWLLDRKIKSFGISLNFQDIEEDIKNA